MIVLIVGVLVLIAVVAVYLRQIYSTFEKHGVKTLKPFPILGNMTSVVFRRVHFADEVVIFYKAFPGERFVGKFEFVNPLLVIRDLDLVKKITIKDFEHFLDHRTMSTEIKESYLNRNLATLTGQEWKDMRSTLSPAFTSSKIRFMVPFMVEVGDRMIENLNHKIESSIEGYIDIECKDLATRYANDVIASCAFGLKINSHTDEDNEFYVMGKRFTQFSARQLILAVVALIVPKLGRLLKIEFMAPEMKNFFKTLVIGTMKDREERNIIRPDMIHLLMEAKKGKLTHDNIKSHDDTTGFATAQESSVGSKAVSRVWTEVDLIAQAVVFFLAGFDTVSTAMSFLLHELALNPEVQEKLAQEIKEHDEKNGGKFDLKSIQEMRYMDMVVSELLRKYPPAVALDRLCTKDYNLGRPNEHSTKDFILRKGKIVSIPVLAFHRDPEYFPNPEKFNPERFSEENRHKIHPFAYMPFGLGPRNCIASRFALCEVKVMVYQILQHMELSPCEKTCIPPEFCKNSVNLKLKGGHWLRFRPRV